MQIFSHMPAEEKILTFDQQQDVSKRVVKIQKGDLIAVERLIAEELLIP